MLGDLVIVLGASSYPLDFRIYCSINPAQGCPLFNQRWICRSELCRIVRDLLLQCCLLRSKSLN